MAASTSNALERCAGLVFGFLFHNGRATRVSDNTLADHIGHDHDWVWLHLSLADRRAHRFLEGFEALPARARILMLAPDDRIQFHLTETGAWGLLPDIERDFDEKTIGAGRLVFWFDGHHLITARRHSLTAVDQLRDRILEGLVLNGPMDALVKLEEHFVEIVEQRLSTLSMDLGRIEDDVLADRDHVGRDALSPLRREISRHAREFSGLRSAIHRVLGTRHVVEASPLLARLPQVLQEAEDFERDAAALSDRARLLYEEIGSRLADRTNRSLSALTVISTLLLPPTFVAGAFGINVGGMPWAQNPNGFWIVIMVCVLMVFVSYAVLRKFRILP
ncbi:MAG TPA: CorA family divalent cation transporter [Rhizomicrobium sp.]